MTGRIEDSPAARDALRQHLEAHPEPATNERIFVNRALRMETIRCVGFDLDWTLADYERLPLERLVFELARDRLIDHHGYPDRLRRVALRPDFPRRGLLIDKQAGTVLRMSRHRFVNLAYFGRERLDRDELKRLYRYEPIQPASERFYHIDSLFELPETNLYAELIELAKHNGDLAQRSYREIFTDVRTAIDWVHAERALKARVEADTPTFLERDPLLALALLRLRLGGRRLFLLTNSGWRYASHLCSYLFDGILPGLDSWRQLFDLVVVAAAVLLAVEQHQVGRQREDPGDVRALGTADLLDRVDGRPRMDAPAGDPDQVGAAPEIEHQLGQAGAEGDDAHRRQCTRCLGSSAICRLVQ